MDKSLAHSKWICKYHIIFTFTPKYRKKIIYNKVIIILRKANVRFNIRQAGPHFLIKLEKPRFVFFSVLGFYNVLEFKEYDDKSILVKNSLERSPSGTSKRSTSLEQYRLVYGSLLG